MPPVSLSTTQLVPEHRRLIRDIAETTVGGENISAKSRVGRKTREAVGAVATADGGLELEVSEQFAVHVAPSAEL